MGNRKSLAEKIRDAKACCREAIRNATGRSRELLKGDWKVLLIKHDAKAGKYVTKTLCCDESKHLI